jgi:hypothetical protein
MHLRQPILLPKEQPLHALIHARFSTEEQRQSSIDDWPDRLHMSQMQHARSNFYTRKRIERAHDGLWARGAAVGNTVIGYKRRPTLPATETEPAKGPFYDEIDE